MSDQIPVPPVISEAQNVRPPAIDPIERVEIPNFIVAIESILRHPRRVTYQLRQPEAGRLIRMMLIVSVGCGLVYGFVTGTFSGGTQLWAAPVKITGGLIFSALICLPSLYIFSCLSGSPARLVEVGGLLAGLLMMMTVLMIGFAPITWVFSQSTESLAWMGTLHLVFWLIATAFGLRFLESGFAGLVLKSRSGLRTWVIIFLVVALQMSTALRPIIGTSDTFLPTKKQFFATHWSECMEEKEVTSRK